MHDKYMLYDISYAPTVKATILCTVQRTVARALAYSGKKPLL
jgi:hypothetical protein